MGWTFTQGFEKKDLVRERISTHENETGRWSTLAHSVKGNVLWYVREVLIKATGETKRFICCDLLAKQKNYGWGYKDMDESMHPYNYDCPLSYLRMAPVLSQEWRDNVLKYHEEKAIKNLTKAILKVGDRLQLKGSTTPYVDIVEVGKKILGHYNGRVYRIPPRHFGTIIQKGQ